MTSRPDVTGIGGPSPRPQHLLAARGDVGTGRPRRAGDHGNGARPRPDDRPDLEEMIAADVLGCA